LLQYLSLHHTRLIFPRNNQYNPATIAQIQRAIQALQAEESLKGSTQPQQHKFWETQPVVQDSSPDPDSIGPIENKTLDQVQQKPYPLPKGFEWDTVDLTDETHMHEVYQLLYHNYVEDDDCNFRFHYSKDFLKWALMPPGYKREWHLVVRRTTTPDRPIIGLITGIPCKLKVNEQDALAVEINFLCVHKDLRSKRVAPMLIKEITRRVNLFDIWHAAYTAGIVVPRPVSQAQYFHRSLNPKKLIDVGFSGKPKDMTILDIKKKYQLPSTHKNKLIPLTKELVPSATKLLNSFHQSRGTQLYQHFEEEDFEHFFMPRKNIILSYVMVNEENEVTDFTSFYNLPSTIFGNPEYNTLNVTYSFYNVAGSIDMTQLINDALIISKNEFSSDVFNMLDLGLNNTCFQELKFTAGDGTLHYYVYNWKCPKFPSEKLGLVLF
jgi:glycylpeptide N-tetradecanoyltransferase